MKADMRPNYQPLTPPSVGNEMPPGQHHIVQYDTVCQAPYISTPTYDLDYTTPHDRCAKPPPAHRAEADTEPIPAFGLGIDNVGLGSAARVCSEHDVNPIPHNLDLQSGSPLTPRSVNEADDDGHQAHRDRPLGPSDLPDKTGPAIDRRKLKPAGRKPRAKKGERTKAPELTAPLSVLTKDQVDIPLRDIEAWVNRSSEERQREPAKRQGYVARPMNSFMLYRSAYAERCKHLYSKNNHQDVSAVCGASWRMESPEIVELYNSYAKTERTNHQNAHPTYKFSPSKQARRRREDGSDGDRSDFEDSTWSPSFAKSRYGQPRRVERALSYTSSEMSPPDMFDQGFGPNEADFNKSAWGMVSDSRPLPLPISHDQYYTQYSHPSMQPPMTMGTNSLEELRLRGLDHSGHMMPFASNHDLLGLPGGNSMTIMQQMHSPASTQLGDEHEVDPMLLTYDGSQHEAMLSSPIQHHGFFGLDEQELERHRIDELVRAAQIREQYRTEMWQADSHISPLEQESEFDAKWVGHEQWSTMHAG